MSDSSITANQATSAPPLTLEGVWELFRESDRQFQETKRYLRELAEKTDRQMAETNRRMAETDRQMAETSREVERTSREVEKASRLVKQVSKDLGSLGNRLGEFVEHLVAPAVVRLFREQRIDVHAFHHDIEAERNGEALQIDLLVVNDGSLVAVECKSKLTEEYVDQHLARLEKLKRVMPIYRHHQVMGAVAGMVIPRNVANYATKQGLYVLIQNGEQIELRNPENFTPKVW